MLKFFTNILNISLITTGLFALIMQFHCIFGCLISLCQWPIITIVAIILWIKRKQKRTTVYVSLLAVGGLLFLNLSYEQIKRFHFTSPVGTKNKVSILSYNLFFKNKYPQQILNEIQEVNPDILVVQELTGAWEGYLKQKIAERYKYQKLYIHNGTHGLGLLSKYPIESCEYIKNKSGLPVSQINNIVINGKALILVNTHLPSPGGAVENPDNFYALFMASCRGKKEQWEKIENTLNEKYQGQPQVVAGDLNTMGIEPLYRHIRHDWRDLFAEKGKGSGWTFPNIAKMPPLITLDYILFRGNIKPITSKVLKGSSSDHLAIYGEIEI